MTEEQIKQNALKAEKEHGNFNYQYQGEAFNKGYLAGAHSRDEEVEQLRKALSSTQQAMAELAHMACNPWISVEDKLPERMTSRDSNGARIINCCSKDVFGYDALYKIGRLVCYNHETEMWESHDAYTIGEITHWMPIPELKKGE